MWSLIFFYILFLILTFHYNAYSFPNVNSLLAEDDYGTPYLRVIDFIINGSIGSAVATIFVLTLGFWTAAAVCGAPGNNVPIPTHSVPY